MKRICSQLIVIKEPTYQVREKESPQAQEE
jgi:hypothetical protein